MWNNWLNVLGNSNEIVVHRRYIGEKSSGFTLLDSVTLDVCYYFKAT